MRLTVLQSQFHTKDSDFPRAEMLEDGSILYHKRPKDWEPPPEIQGYKRDPKNKWLFHPQWLNCSTRFWQLVNKPCGAVDVRAFCKHPEAPYYNNRVSHSVCSRCPLRTEEKMPEAKRCQGCPEGVPPLPTLPTTNPFAQIPQIYYTPMHLPQHHPLSGLQYTLIPDPVQRVYPRPFFYPDGSLEYPRLEHHTQPPDDIDGYVRDESNPWKFRPVWPNCAMRLQGTRIKESGCIEVKMVCQNPEAASTFNKAVTCKDCQACPFKKDLKPQPTPKPEQ